jgi:hypothetical protein
MKDAKEQFLKDNLKAGEVYAGIVLGEAGEPDYHLVLLPGESAGTWEKAKAFAHEAGGELPTRREQRLLWVNAKGQFQADWYWSCEQHASLSDYAWMQDFVNGNQNGYLKSYTNRARAVRRLKIL